MKYNQEGCDTYHLEAVNCLLNLNNINEAFVMIDALRAKVNSGIPLKPYATDPGRNENKNLKNCIHLGHVAYYNKGKEEESNGDQLYMRIEMAGANTISLQILGIKIDGKIITCMKSNISYMLLITKIYVYLYVGEYFEKAKTEGDTDSSINQSIAKFMYSFCNIYFAVI